MTALSLQLRYYAAAISIMAAVENRFAESSGSLVEMTENHGDFIIHAVCGEHDGEDVQGFIITDADGEVLDAGGVFDELLIEIDAIVAAEAAELDAIGDEEGDDIASITASGVDAQGYSVTIDTQYSVNGDGEPTETITRSVTDGEGSVSGTVTVLVTDSDGTRFVDSITDLDGEPIAEGDDDNAEATVTVAVGIIIVVEAVTGDEITTGDAAEGDAATA